MRISDKLTFGQYKGLTIRQIYQGTLNINRLLLRDYLKESFKEVYSWYPCYKSLFILFNCHLDNLEINEFQLKLTPEYSDPGGSSDKRMFLEDYSDDFHQYIAFSNENIITGNLAGFPLASYNSRFKQKHIIGGDPEYLEWLITSSDKFFIYPKELEILENLTISCFTGIKFMQVEANVYDYSESMVMKRFKFKENTKKLNLDKASFV